ncbi:MAG: NAD(P)-dependent alcohol dehydrogenase [Rhodobacteraceae bacterium]|nr:NAD(P)-dependent alcohol dehydrogenase [Paracoccaceae bacterium]
MRAYQIIAGDGVDAVALTDRPAPTPGHGEVAIDVKACSLNFRDLNTIKGYGGAAAKPIGRVPLSDGAGVVSAAGGGVEGVKVGDRVAPAFMPGHLDGPLTPEKQAGSLGGAGADGMLAEQVVMPATGVVKMPAHLSFEEAATLPCAAVTAWYALFVGAQTKPGDTVLLLGTGGVSIFALQFAKLAGARVILTSSSDDKLARAKTLGADHVVNYRTTPDWDQAVLDLTGGAGADVAVEVCGPGTLNKTLQAVRFSGSISLMGVLTGLADQVDTMSILRKNIKIQGTYVGSVAVMRDMLRAIDINQLRPVVDKVFPFEDAPAALRFQESGAHFGKVVVKMGE